MKTLKFVKQKGCCQIGYVGNYEDEQANILIKKGFAVELGDNGEAVAEKKTVKQSLTKKED